MLTRKKWTSKEDLLLREIVKMQEKPYKWDVISFMLKKKQVEKSSKQCRERWMHQLNPNLKKEKWDLQENKKLFELHSQMGNHWKDIALHYPGRSDNSIKNNFFSLIRKSLRNACKIIGNYQGSCFINKIKPKILSIFMKQILNVSFENKREQTVRIREVIQRLAFGKYAEIYTSMNEDDKFILNQCLLFLQDLNKRQGSIDEDSPRQKKIEKLKRSVDSFKDNSKVSESKSIRIDKSIKMGQSQVQSADSNIQATGFQYRSSIHSNNDVNLWIDFLFVKKLISGFTNLRINLNDTYRQKQFAINHNLMQIKTQIEQMLEKLQNATKDDIEHFYQQCQLQQRPSKELPKNYMLQQDCLGDDNFKNPNFSKEIKQIIKRKESGAQVNSQVIGHDPNKHSVGLESLQMSNFMNSQTFIPTNAQQKNWLEAQFLGSYNGSKMSDNQQFLEFSNTHFGVEQDFKNEMSNNTSRKSNNDSNMFPNFNE